MGESAPRGLGEGAGFQHLYTTTLCLQGQDLECNAISTAPVGGGIQQLLEGDHGHLSIKSTQFGAHLEHLQGQAVGLHTCSMQVELVRACGQTVKSQVLAHCATKGRHVWLCRSPQTFRSTVCKDFEVTSISFWGGEWYVQAKDKPLWCRLVQGIPPIKATPALMRKQPAQTCKC